MKKLSIYILSAFIALAYLMSVVGVSVHTCQHSGKQRIVLLANETCLCGHDHDQAPSCTGDEDTCCDMAYQVLKVDQEAHSAKSLLKRVTEYCTWLFAPAAATELPHAAPVMACNHRPPPLTPNTLPSIFRLSQLRL